ncbi:MAG: translation initiation factor IF-2 [Actinobacteria bacterium]|jgi:translation initiation factor IF-2|nr:MAG: translation initiation factor IF-2 [Actinomycetota bacterium]
MAGKRVHQLAKELGMTSKELLDILQSMGEDIQNPLSSLSEDTEKAVTKKLAKGEAEKPKKKPAAKQKPSGKTATDAKTEDKKGKAQAARKPARPAAKKKAAPAPAKKPPEKDKEKTAEKTAEAKRPPSRVKEESAGAPAAAGITKPAHSGPPPTAPGRPAGRSGQPVKHPARRRPDRREQPRGERREGPRMEKPPAPREPGTLPMKKKLRVPAGITVREFAQRVGKKPSQIISMLMSIGEMITMNQAISEDALLLVAEELGVDLEVKSRAIEEAVTIEDEKESLQPRPPVVTVMGHVDHGKTSLLDAIRKTAVTDQEMGGITQHIGASVVESEGKSITFVDTPGHESFTALRARGAKVTDIAVLVVAADDGVMPQTVEAIDHARAAEVPIMVAVNKIDKPEANPTRVRQQLTEYNLLPEEWGGETIFVDVSAKEGTNLDHLLEMILLLAEMHDYRANPDAHASGNIIEASLDKGRGPVATLLVKRGTLRRGDALMAGKAYGRVRAIVDDKGRMIQEAGPSAAVEILGLNTVPEAGDEFAVVEDEKKARAIAGARVSRERAADDRKAVRTLSLEDLFRQIQEGEVQEFNLIIKGDTQGSLEAIRDSVAKIKVGDIVVNIIRTGVGAINENDVMLARASNAVVIGFNVRPDSSVQEIATKEKVEIRTYRVIYQLLEELEAALVGMLKPEYEEVKVGELEVRALFRVPRQGAIAGSYVKEGEINRNSQVRLVRDGAIVFEGGISSLRRFKDDVRSVSAGYECGVGLENFQDIKEGDVIEVIEMREIPRSSETADS